MLWKNMKQCAEEYKKYNPEKILNMVKKEMKR